MVVSLVAKVKTKHKHRKGIIEMKISLAICLVLLLGCEPPDLVEQPPIEQLEHDSYDDPVLDQLRKDHQTLRGIKNLKITPHKQLDQAARLHAEWMANNDKMSHTGSGGTSFWDRIKQTGYKGQSGGENIAAGYRTPQDAFRGWVGSEGHLQNIMNPNWQHIGLGFAKSANSGRIYWCAVFAKPVNQDATKVEAQKLSLPEPLNWED